MPKSWRRYRRSSDYARNTPRGGPKELFPGIYTGHCKGISPIEAEPEQLNHLAAYGFPEIKQEFQPLIEVTELMELYFQMKKET